MAAARATVVGDVLNRPLGGRRKQPAQRPDSANSLEGAAQFGLEDDDERQQADDRARLQDLRQQLQAERLGGDVDRVEDSDADDQADRTCSADEAEQSIDQDRRQRNIEDRDWQLDFEASDQFQQLVKHPPDCTAERGPAG